MVGVLVLAASLFVGAFLCTWLVWRRLPKGSRGMGLRAGVLSAALLLALVAWYASLPSFTHAVYVCLVCGRTERQEHAAGVTYASRLIDDGDAYAQRFLGGHAQDHSHDWHLESCIYNAAGSVSCTMETVARWFDTLPHLRDREGADVVFREAQSLDRQQRCRLMNEFGYAVAFAQDKPRGVDAAFDAWCAERR